MHTQKHVHMCSPSWHMSVNTQTCAHRYAYAYLTSFCQLLSSSNLEIKLAGKVSFRSPWYKKCVYKGIKFWFSYLLSMPSPPDACRKGCKGWQSCGDLGSDNLSAGGSIQEGGGRWSQDEGMLWDTLPSSVTSFFLQLLDLLKQNQANGGSQSLMPTHGRDSLSAGGMDGSVD